MLRPAVGEIINKDQNYYSLVVAVAKRAREIAQDAEEKGEILVEKPVKMAVEEFYEGKYHFEEPQEEDEKEEKDVQ